MAARLKKDKLELQIYHGIFLTPEERHMLVSGQDVETVGVSVPVWNYRSTTSEPAVELFCKYRLTNRAAKANIVAAGEGYWINVPPERDEDKPQEPLSDEKWREMTLEQQERWYAKRKSKRTVRLLLDIAEGGAAYLRFDINKRMQRDNRQVSVQHLVEIQGVEVLMDSLAV